MSIRLDITSDGKLEILRSWINDPMTRFLYLDTAVEEKYLRIVAYLIRREIRRTREEKFVPRLDKECNRLLKSKLTENVHAKS